MKIAFFDTKIYDKPFFEKYGKEYGVEIKFFETKLNADTAKLAKGFEGVCAFVNDEINAEVIDKLCERGVKLVALRCAGFNNVDMKYAEGKLRVLRVPAYSPYAVAEHAMALLLTSVRRIHKAYIRSKEFNFSLSGLTGFDLYKKTVGVLGTGKIGKVFIDICKGFGMRVLAYDKYPDLSLEKEGKVEYVTLDKLFSESDVISLHCPLTEETYHVIDEKSIDKMKKGVVIINTSRGKLIDTEDLIYELEQEHIGGLGLDVYEDEEEFFLNDMSNSYIRDKDLSTLLTMPNVVVT